MKWMLWKLEKSIELEELLREERGYGIEVLDGGNPIVLVELV